MIALEIALLLLESTSGACYCLMLPLDNTCWGTCCVLFLDLSMLAGYLLAGILVEGVLWQGLLLAAIALRSYGK